MDDSKTKTLREHGTLNPRPEKVEDILFLENEFFDPRDIVQVKYEMLRRVQVDKQTVAGTVESFGFTRPSFYKAQAMFAKEGIVGLTPKKRGPRGRHKLTDNVMSFVEELLEEEPSLQPPQIVEHLQGRFGLTVHRRSIERALAAHKKKPQEAVGR